MSLLRSALLLGAAVDAAVINGYLLIDDLGAAKLQALAAQAASLPLNRITVSFFDPTLVYIPGSKSLQYSGLNLTQSGDYGFALLASSIASLRAGGVDVFLSLGGWNNGCNPYPYMYYSVGGYGTSTPNYWKIQQYGGGSPAGCVESNSWCYVCEPKWEYTPLGGYSMFPTPEWSPSWTEAVQYVTATAGGAAPIWMTDMMPGGNWTDPNTGITVPVPGQSQFVSLKRDPYEDMVILASELGASGIDLDYEEVWYADLTKTGPAGGPWVQDQLTYKYSAIAQDLRINIAKHAPTLQLASAVTATSAWSGNWWGGNLKGYLVSATAWYPDLVAFITAGSNAGGFNQMTYDLSDNEQYHECPVDGVCTLDAQVQYYAATFTTLGVPAAVGFETGTPAYPDPTHDPAHQLPLTPDELSLIMSQTVPGHTGVFMWELYKAFNSSQVSPNTLLQTLCASLLPGAARCSGSLPSVTHGL